MASSAVREYAPSVGQPARWRELLPIVPLVAFLLLLFVYPVGQLLWLSVVDSAGDLSLTHYARLFSTSTYVRVLGVTFEIALWTTVISIVAGYPLAYLIATTRYGVRGVLILFVLVPFWTSFLVRTFAWLVLLGRNGAINDWMMSLGLTDGPLPLIYNRAGVLIGMVHALMPVAVLTMVSVMRSIDPALSGAAGTLGARGSQAFWRIYLPLSMPGVVAGALLVFVLSLGFFITPALLGSGREILIAQVIIEQIEQMLNWGFAGAVSVLFLLATLAVIYLYERFFGGHGALHAGTSSRSVAQRNAAFEKMVSSLGHRLVIWLSAISGHIGRLLERIRPVSAARRQLPLARLALWLVALITLVFLAAPSLFVIPVSFSQTAYIQWPPAGFTLDNYELVLNDSAYIGAMLRSLIVGLGSAALAMAIGVPAAFGLVRRNLPGKRAILAMALAPMILPHIVIAIALFFLYAKLGLVGTVLGLILGHACISVPFVIVTVMAVLGSYDERLDFAAWSLGANRWQAFGRITLPIILPGIIAAFLFAFVISLDELSIALFISGGTRPTLPKQLWVDSMLRVSPVVTAVATIVLVFVTTVILVAEFTRRWAERRSSARLPEAA
jgi:putative spermidine/putrescine transport system permease protein